MAQVKQVERIGKFITVASAAKRSGFSPSFVNYLTRVGDVYAVKFGGCLGIDMQSLDEYVVRKRKTVEQRSEEE